MHTNEPAQNTSKMICSQVKHVHKPFEILFSSSQNYPIQDKSIWSHFDKSENQRLWG